MASSPDWITLDRALDRALDLDGLERTAFLATLDDALRAALAPLLRDALSEHALLDHPDSALGPLKDGLATSPGPDGQLLHRGTRVGPYEIEALVGEGGMGRVFRAHRADGAFEQTVAVKVVRASLTLAGADVAARLRRERDVLAALDHPGIARLLDGGETDDGVPYLVTEFVDGAPITSWAAARGLGVPARVRLLIDVARAVDHAHRRFVVHRDLKPSNVLVAERDGAARPVVLDFGIAKLLEGAEKSSTSGLPLTQTGLRLLTPAYAAPELFQPAAAVTAAVDVYGLGALLYELLTSFRPHDQVSPTGPLSPPARPSEAVRTGVLEPPAPDPQARARALRGDLDTICLKALHPDPARRYHSAAALADDLARHLDGRPVEARPDSVAYVAGRFARRHRAAVAAAAVALLALVVGLGVALVALGNERKARAEAEVAVTRATEASSLLAGLFQMADPDYDPGRAVTVIEAVEEGVRRVGAVESEPLRAYLLFLLGDTYIHLGEPVTADSLLQASLALYGADARGEDVTSVRRRLLLTRDALADPDGVLALGQQVYADHRTDADPGHARAALLSMSGAYSRLGRHENAVEAARQALALGQMDAQRLGALLRLGESLSDAGRDAEAVPYLEDALEQSVARYGREDGRTLRALTTLGQTEGRRGRIDRAEALLGEGIAFHASRYGANRVGYPLASLGMARLRSGRFQEAAATLDSAIAMAGPIISPTHPDIGAWLALRAEACNGYGAYDEAERSAREALTIAEDHAPNVTVAHGRALAQLGFALQGQRRHADARAALRRAQTALAQPGAQPALRKEEVEAVRAALATLPGQ